jgi:glutamate N-acetyltransferase / amino-acid N-acetyltransferase
MTVTFPAGFVAAGVSAGLKATGARDVAVLVNTGPSDVAAAVWTSNRCRANPVLWSERVVQDGHARVVVVNSGGANCYTGPPGFQATHATAELAARLNGCAPIDVVVCSTGLIGHLNDEGALLGGVEAAMAAASRDGGAAAAEAIMTTDTVPKEALVDAGAWSVGGIAKGAGMLAPGLATMLVFLTTDADVTPVVADAALRSATRVTFDRLDSDGCMSTNDTVLLLASGASGVQPDPEEFGALLATACDDLANQLMLDAEGASKAISIQVVGAESEEDAVAVGRAVARSSLFKCAIHGEDPNWGRVLAAVGTTAAAFDADQLNVAINGVWVCKNGAAAEDRAKVDLGPRDVTVTVDLAAGSAEATVLTTDLTAAYVHENSAYST